MTTPQAAALYELEHIRAMKNKGYAVYNPNNKPLDELPVIYGFNNGGRTNFYQALSMAEDGTHLGSHLCSSESYILHDLGILEGTREDRHETYRNHYPEGYRMDFVSFDNVQNHEKLMKAIAIANKEGNP